MQTKPCPDCLGEIPEQASFCRHCGQRVDGKACPQCGARNWEQASVCRWCAHRYAATTEPPPDFAPFAVTPARLATLLHRGRLLPQTIKLTRDKILISTPGPFNLSRQDEEIPWAKVAGFDYKSGIFWDQITIETRGQSSSKMLALARQDGDRIRRVLQTLET